MASYTLLDNERAVTVHNPYSFDCYDIISTPTSSRSSSCGGSDDLEQWSSGSVTTETFTTSSSSDEIMLIVTDDVVVPKHSLIDSSGILRNPCCGHAKRNRLRMKRRIAYFECCECAARWKEISSEHSSFAAEYADKIRTTNASCLSNNRCKQ